VLQVNYEYYDNQTAESALELVKSLQRGEKPNPTRGAPLSDLRTTERQLAGFFDRPGGSLEDTVDGGSAATETLRGARMAQERGWTAPPMPDDADIPALPEKK
jgi:NADH-quinone oxidoreductase subunit E